MAHSNKTLSPLRTRMIEDMTIRKLSAKTQSAYIRAVANFTRFLGQSPDTAGAEDLRRYQLHLVEQGVSTTTINATITGLKMFFEATLDRPEAMKKMRHIYKPRKIPEILSTEEVTRLLQAIQGLLHLIYFALPAHETRQPPPRGYLELEGSITGSAVLFEQ